MGRGLRAPALAVIAENAGLARALTEAWPQIELPSCVVHMLRNLEAKALGKLREEVAEDFRRMMSAETAAWVAKERAAVTKKWRLRCAAVAKSFEEAGDELFTFLHFPTAQWRALRTPNALERINEEFRRRTKTQAMLPSEDAVLFLLVGLLPSGQTAGRRCRRSWRRGERPRRDGDQRGLTRGVMMPELFHHLTDRTRGGLTRCCSGPAAPAADRQAVWRTDGLRLNSQPGREEIRVHYRTRRHGH